MESLKEILKEDFCKEREVCGICMESFLEKSLSEEKYSKIKYKI